VFGFWRSLRPQEVDLDAVVRLDLYYVQNWSLGLDFRVALQSLGQMLRGRMPRLRADNGDWPPEEAGS
jgi:lipopolysaccharide/colanic/teichoic acid biosynthesis glycosyltransferase